MKYICTILFLMYSLVAFSQTVISGKITDKKQQPISDVSVVTMNTQDSSIIAYTTSNNGGNYVIKTDNRNAEFLLCISSLEIKKQIKRIANRTQTVNFLAESGSIELREVVVKSQKIWVANDTINYLVSAFKNKKDIVIGDVLKKLPGVSVEENGQIKYKGIPINKFYIEGMDMLQGRYGIATNNVSVDDVVAVQVLENHQPIKALKVTMPSTAAAINLKIREDRKGIFTATAVAGLGSNSDLLWHGELNGMYFGKGFQHMSTYKADNAGNNILRDLNSFYKQEGIGEMQMTSMQQPSAPNISYERYFFNNSHAVTLNNLKKLKNDAELNFNLIFSNNRDQQHGFTRTKYILPGDSTVTVSEDISTWNRTNRLETELRYNQNKENYYLNNYLNVSIGWNDRTGEIITANPIRQRFDNRVFRASNATHWVKTKEEGRGFEFLSVNSMMSQPHSLTITPGLYPEIFNDKRPYQSLTQQLHVNGFASNNRFSLLSALMLGDVRINPSVSVNFERRTFVSGFDLVHQNSETVSVTDTAMRNDLGWTRFYSAIDLGVSYNSESFKFNLSFPVGYNHTLIDNAFRPDPYKRDKVYFQPAATASWTLTSSWELTARYGFGVNSPGLATLYNGYILSGYRTLNRYDTRIFDSYRQRGALGVSYKDVFSMFFLNTDVSMSHYRSDAMYGQTMNGILTVTRLNEQPNRGNSLSVSGEASKGFEWKGLVVKANTGWGRNIGGQLRQGKLVDYTSQWLSTGGALNMKVTQWLFAEYNVNWGRSRGEVSTGETFPAMQSLSQKGTLKVELPFGIGVNGTYEHYYNNALPKVNRNFSLADLGLTYILNRVSYSLNWTNILNISKFITSSYGDLNSYYSEYDIRPTQVMVSVRFKLK